MNHAEKQILITVTFARSSLAKIFHNDCDLLFCIILALFGWSISNLYILEIMVKVFRFKAVLVILFGFMNKNVHCSNNF